MGYSVHKARDIKDSSSECSRFIRKSKEQTSRKKCISKKSTPSVGNVVNFNSACKIITKESDAKSY